MTSSSSFASFSAVAGETSAFFHALIFHCADRARPRSDVAMSSATTDSRSAGSKMEKPGFNPAALASMRRIFNPSAWNVATTTFAASPPLPCDLSSACARSRISRAALLVNVIAKIFAGSTPRSIRCAILAVMTRVLPLPAPASTSSGPSTWRTASRCGGLRRKDKRAG